VETAVQEGLDFVARINLEDELFSKKRWMNLVIKMGSPEAALGALCFAWITAQKFWYPQLKRIPRNEWVKEGLREEIIECGFADENSEGIYVSGSMEQFQWLFDAKDRGEKSAEARRNKIGSAQPKRSRKPFETLSENHDNTPKRSEPLTLPLTHNKELIPSVLSVDSSSPSLVEFKLGMLDFVPPKVNQVIAHWCELYKGKYRANYEVDKKTAGMLSHKCKQWSFEKFSTLFQCYLAIDEKFYAEQKHPLTLFFRDLQKINVAAQTGKNPATAALDALFDREMLVRK
jgi:hypothetical protein